MYIIEQQSQKLFLCFGK